MMGSTGYCLMKLCFTSCLSNITDCVTYDEAIQSLEEVFVKPKNKIFARHLLAMAKQEPGISLDEFLQKLCHLSKDCNFKAINAAKYCEESIQDAFINGLSLKTIPQRLEDVTLDLKSVFTKARILDLAQKSSELYSFPTDVLIVAAAEEHHAEEESVSASTVRRAYGDGRKYSTCKFCCNHSHPKEGQRSACPAEKVVF